MRIRQVNSAIKAIKFLCDDTGRIVGAMKNGKYYNMSKIMQDMELHEQYHLQLKLHPKWGMR